MSATAIREILIFVEHPKHSERLESARYWLPEHAFCCRSLSEYAAVQLEAAALAR